MVEDNDEVEDNDKDDNNYNDISALGLDRDLGFSRGCQTKPYQTKLAQIRANSHRFAKIRANSRRFAQTCADSRKLAQIRANSRRFAQTCTKIIFYSLQHGCKHGTEKIEYFFKSRYLNK